jgi:hypothetical protein
VKSIIVACCMVIIGSVAAHPQDHLLSKRFRIAQNCTPGQCSQRLTSCNHSCVGNVSCLNQCQNAFNTCNANCNNR